tara:strand:+ start:178 stop:573 length:396 start_codon:yes stop_codon:yes gene_type:complete
MKNKTLLVFYTTLILLISCKNENTIVVSVKEESNSNVIVTPLEKGKKLFINNCAICHGNNGNGLGPTFPPVANADYVKKKSDLDLYDIIKNGISGEIIVNGIKYNGVMLGVNLNRNEIENIIKYLRYLNDE